jgi:hypothetical protein
MLRAVCDSLSEKHKVESPKLYAFSLKIKLNLENSFLSPYFETKFGSNTIIITSHTGFDL